jgi:hypothetical protein
MKNNIEKVLTKIVQVDICLPLSGVKINTGINSYDKPFFDVILRLETLPNISLKDIKKLDQYINEMYKTTGTYIAVESGGLCFGFRIIKIL